MLTIEVTLLHGTIRAGAADDLALTGAETAGEWPPSPARLVAALVAGDGTGERCRVTDGSELVALERARPPVIHADPDREVARSPLVERYVVLNKTAENTVQGYPARTNGVARSGTRLSPRHPSFAYVWGDLDLGAETVDALRARSARVGYLGCADSPVRMRVHDRAPSPEVPTTVWQPDPAGATVLPVPFDGYVEVLDVAYDMFLEGRQVRRSWFRSEHERYASPAAGEAPGEPRGTMIGLRFDLPVSGRRVLAVTETLRAAVLDLYQREVAGPGGDPPAVLHGHDMPAGRQHAHFLALPDVGHRHARGRIHGAAIWLPDDAPDDVVDGVRHATWHLSELVRPGVLRVGVRPWAGEPRPRAAVPARWTTPARRWVSAFPVVHEQFVRPEPTLASVAEWCWHAGLPEAPVAMRQSRVPLAAGGVSLHPREAAREGQSRMPYSHMELLFDRPVAGPVVIGRARQFGLGLCVPAGPAGEGEVASRG